VLKCPGREKVEHKCKGPAEKGLLMGDSLYKTGGEKIGTNWGSGKGTLEVANGWSGTRGRRQKKILRRRLSSNFFTAKFGSPERSCRGRPRPKDGTSGEVIQRRVGIWGNDPEGFSNRRGGERTKKGP